MKPTQLKTVHPAGKPGCLKKWPSLSCLLSQPLFRPARGSVVTPLDTTQKCPLAVICFAVLCWLNCVAIEHWETTNGFEPSFKHMHATTKWAGRNLARIALAVCVIALEIAAATTMLPKTLSLQSVFLSAALSAIALFALDRFRRKLSSIQLRIAADAALLTPLIFLLR